MSQMHDRHNSSMILQVPPSILKQVTHNQVNLHERSPHLSLSLVSMIHSWMFSRNIKYETFEMDVLWSCHLRCLTTRGRITMLLMFLLSVSPSVIVLSTSLRRWMTLTARMVFITISVITTTTLFLVLFRVAGLTELQPHSRWLFGRRCVLFKTKSGCDR